MTDYTKYTDKELTQACNEAYAEYYRLATVVRPTPPTKKDLEPLEKAIDKYDEILNEIERRLGHLV